jgi:uncharacterized protein
MTSRRQHRALSLEELDDWLASDHAPAKGGWNVSAVDGFLAGIIVGPEPIEPKEWTRLIFGRRPLGKDADAAVQAVLDRHATVAKILAEAPAHYAPLFMRTDEGIVLAQDWAAGFLAAVRLRLEAWRPLLEGPAWIGLLLPILVHTPDPTIEAQIARLPAGGRHHLAEAYRHIPTAVAALREHFLPARLAAATTLSRIH